MRLRTLFQKGFLLLMVALPLEAHPDDAEKELIEATSAAARHLEDCVRSGRREDALRVFDLDEFVSRAISGVEITGTNLRIQQQGVRAAFSEKLWPALKADEFHLLRTRKNGKGEMRALFRQITNLGINYTEVVFMRNLKGGMQGVDWFSYHSGELVSEHMRRRVIGLVADENRGLLDRLTGKQSDYVRHIKVLIQMDSNLSSKDWLALYQKLPATLQEDRSLLAGRLTVSHELDDAKGAQEAVATWRRLFPKDPTLDLKLIEHYAVLNDYPKSLAAIDSIDAYVGGDPYLNVIRGGTYQLMGNPQEVSRCLQKAVEQEPRLGKMPRLAPIFATLAKPGVGVTPAAPPSGSPTAARPSSGVASPASPAPVAAPADPLRLRGIIYSKSRPRAMIGPAMVTVGEKVSGHEVIQIEPDQVTVRSPTGELRVLRMGATP